MKSVLTILKFMVKQNTKNGSYTLEAAILLPLFIVGILTLGFTIRMIATAENIAFATTDEARVAAGAAYNIPIAPLFPIHLQDRIVNENPDISSVDVSDFHYLYQTHEADGLISFRLHYWVGMELPLGMINGMEVSQQYRCRGFIGRTAEGSSLSFDEMEDNSSAIMVWLFPDGGKRYHTKSCKFVSSYPIQTVLNQMLRKRYEPCPLCGSAEAKDGTIVCCFQAYGEAYHLQSCPTVDKYVISMERNQAEARGYTPCLKCGGIE
jgi:hypothetical protein